MIYELRTYTAATGKMKDLLSRFRHYTDLLFHEHNIQSFGYWIEDLEPDKLIYLVGHVGDPQENWKSFLSDERWKLAFKESESNGPLTTLIVSKFITPTDFSILQK